MSTEPSTDAETPVDFEDALRRLETIVDELERGEPALSEALAKYEQGVRLLARCHGELDRAEQSVALLTGVDEAGRPVTAPLDAAGTDTDTLAAPAPPDSAPAPRAARSRKRPPAPPEGDDGFIPF